MLRPKLIVEPVLRSGIYEIVNVANGKRYVGSSINLKTRWQSHRRCLRKDVHRNVHLQGSWNTHGETSFVFRTLLFCSPDNLVMYEQTAMDALNPEYNATRVAGKNSFLGHKHTVETIRKMSVARRKRPHPRGWKRSPEVIAMVAAMHVGRKRSAETCAKISASRLGKPNPKSVAHRAALSKALRGRITCSPEAVARMAETKRGTKLPEEHKAKIRETTRQSWFERKQIITVRKALCKWKRVKARPHL